MDQQFTEESDKYMQVYIPIMSMSVRIYEYEYISIYKGAVQ